MFDQNNVVSKYTPAYELEWNNATEDQVVKRITGILPPKFAGFHLTKSYNTITNEEVENSL
jgi:hypothetical protein